MTPDAQELLAIVAHDIRNPLMCIEGYAELLLSRDLTAAERAKLIARIVSCSRFAEQIVGDILDTSAMERGELAVRKEALSLADVVAEALDSMEHAASSRGVRLTFERGSVSLPVLADPGRIRQLLHNLVGNALKHVRTGSGLVTVRLEERDSDYVVEVVDNGSGIDQKFLPRLFEKYYQADPAARSSIGLGLYIARSIVAAHGGRIWARSGGPDRGATFAFSIPKYDPQLAYAAYKEARGCATPPPRRINGRGPSAGGLRRLAAFAGIVLSWLGLAASRAS